MRVLIPKSRTWRKVFLFLQILFGAKCWWSLGRSRSLNQAGRRVPAAALPVNRYLGTLFVTILAVKYRHLIQIGNSHFPHSLARVKEDTTEAAVQIRNLWNVNVLHTSPSVGNSGTFSILFTLWCDNAHS